MLLVEVESISRPLWGRPHQRLLRRQQQRYGYAQCYTNSYSNGYSQANTYCTA
jgi:hypothetical protein